MNEIDFELQMMRRGYINTPVLIAMYQETNTKDGLWHRIKQTCLGVKCIANHRHKNHRL